MLKFLKRFFTENIGLKIVALVLALGLWIYIVNDLSKQNLDESRILEKILPSQGVVAKKLTIKPIFVGKPRWGYGVVRDKVVIVPEYCIVVGTRDLLDKIRFTYTMPIDLTGASKPISKSVPLNPIAPGVYMEETLVQVTVPIEKSGG